MYVHTPSKKEGVIKHVSYMVSGTEVTDQLERRFSDFFSLRQALVERWPGVYIPNLPPKKAVGNLNEKLIEKRVRLLNVFCYKLSKEQFLFESEEVKLFRSNSADVSKALDKLGKQSYSEIIEKYKVAFPDFYNDYDLNLGKGKVCEFEMFLRNALNSTKKFKETIDETQERNDSDIKRFIQFLYECEIHEKEVVSFFVDEDLSKLVITDPKESNIGEAMLRIKESFTNPYTVLREFLQEDLLDLEAALEAVTSLTKLTNNYDKLNQKIDSLDVELNQLKAGKQSFISGLFKNKEQKIAETEKEKATCEENVDYLHQIIQYGYFNMENFILKFKEEKLKLYHLNMALFAAASKKNINLSTKLWDSLREALAGKNH